jgi:hypothetical protein
MHLFEKGPETSADASGVKLPKLLYRAFNSFRCKYEARRVLRTIDLDRFQVFEERYRTTSPDPGYSKYLNIKYWIENNMHHYYGLDLHQSGPLSILDIGTGCGYFPYICKYFGHQSIGIDLDEVPMYREIIEFLKIDRRICRVNAYERLPDFGTIFNLVTAFLVCFNNHDTSDVWGTNEWDFFLIDLARNQLRENGRVFLSLNAVKSGEYYTQELLAFFRSKGACANDGSVYFRNMAAFLR